MTRTILLLAGLALASLATLVTAEEKETGTKVVFDGLTSTTPADWVKETPANKMRFSQFKLPKAKGDSADAELVIFRGLGGSVEANVARWKGEFQAPEGKTIDDISKVTEFKVAGCQVSQLEISEGTWLSGMPGLPASKKKKNPGYRMIGVQFEGPDNIYHLKLIGPAKTIEAHARGFETFLKGFKK